MAKTTIKKKKVHSKKVVLSFEDKKIALLKAQLLEIERIKASNIAFRKLSPAAKRVSICEDALMYIKQDKVEVTEGTYLESYNLYDTICDTKDGDLREAILKVEGEEEVCKVCAKGVLFYTEVMKRNNINLQKGEIDEEQVTSKMSEYFTVEQLDMIECAFEVRIVADGDDILWESSILGDESEIAIKCIEFGEKYDNEEDRLIGILKNIIKNKGEFKP